MTGLKLDRANTALLVVDIQEKLCAAMEPDALEHMVGRTTAAIVGALELKLPIVFTEQYPKGLGPTRHDLKKLFAGPFVEKTRFSAVLPETLQLLLGRKQVLIAGMETHICVFQTARDLAAQGFQPVVLTDAVISRSNEDRRTGLELVKNAGAQLSTVEAALFDLLEDSKAPEFKRISVAVR